MSDSHSKLDDQQKLEAAFQQFNAVSGQLIDAYSQLESQVTVLNAQLDEANNELRRQVSANAALAERFAMLLEALPAGIIELSSEGRVLAENPAAVSLLGASMSGAAWEDVAARLGPVLPDNTYRTGSEASGDERLLTLEFTALPALGGRLLLLQDVTTLNRLSQEVARQQKLASMGSMAASLAHQLRTPLSTALLYAANLREPSLREEDRQRFIDKILARLRALEGLIQNMLSFVRGQVGEREPLELLLVLEELIAVVGPQCASRQVQLVSQLPDAPGPTMLGDRKALLGALVNLLENALQYSPPGAMITLDVREAQGEVCVVVEDQGPGVPTELQERLFEPFFTTRSGGTGLGLAIVKKVAEELGGRVSCSNLRQGGAHFELCLPLVEHNAACRAMGETE